MDTLLKNYAKKIESFDSKADSIRRQRLTVKQISERGIIGGGYDKVADRLKDQCSQIDYSFRIITAHHYLLKEIEESKHPIQGYDLWHEIFHSLCRLKYFADIGSGCDQMYMIMLKEGSFVLQKLTKDFKEKKYTWIEEATICQMFMEILDHLPIKETTKDREYFIEDMYGYRVKIVDEVLDVLLTVAKDMRSETMIIKIAQFQKDHINDLLDINSFFARHKTW